MKLRLLFSLLLATIPLHVWCGQNFNTPFARAFRNLECVPSVPARLWCWGDRILVQESSNPPIFTSFSPAEMTPRRFAVPGTDLLEGICICQGRLTAIGAAGKNRVLLQYQNREWKQIKIPKGLATGKVPDFVPTNDGVALLTQDTFFTKRILFAFRNGKWMHVAPPAPISTFSGYGYKQYLYGSQLLAGFCDGEWDSKLEMFDIEHPLNGWHNLLDYAITGMATDGLKHLFICGNLVWGVDSLFRYNGSNFETLFEDNNNGGDVMREVPNPSDVVCGSGGKMYTLGFSGIFSWSNKHYKRVVGFDLGDIRPPVNPFTGKVMDSINCDPGCLAVDFSGNFFVSTFGYGVLCFIKDGHGYDLKQVVTYSERQQAAEYYKANR